MDVVLYVGWYAPYPHPHPLAGHYCAALPKRMCPYSGKSLSPPPRLPKRMRSSGTCISGNLRSREPRPTAPAPTPPTARARADLADVAPATASALGAADTSVTASSERQAAATRRAGAPTPRRDMPSRARLLVLGALGRHCMQRGCGGNAVGVEARTAE
ncbi:DNA topoisomerase 2-alpha [Frankliniella fusca]|uniref:DNA topoisomerase 2-alpha n=1 Tax=Frankliniella fusca TaxID=407009 RepID=A0AAE1L8Q9_9NEOP|nr:DNA topoisomerase 2-alpha [Frankliniella fusca]